MKIVLPLAGKGTRLLPHTKKTPKPLMEIAGKSLLAYLMDELIPLKPSEFIFVVGYLKEQIKAFVQENYPSLAVRFVEQNNPQGLGHAVYQAKASFSKDEDMLVVLGDQTFTIDWGKMLAQGCNRISTFTVSDPSSFGVVLADEKGIVLEMEEKPSQPKSNTIISGTYYFQSAFKVFDMLEHQIKEDIRTRGEIQITDTMKLMMENGEKFAVLPIADWNDCGNHADLIRANGVLITKNKLSEPQNTDTKPPVYLDKKALKENSILGPNTSIGANACIKNSTVSNSVISAGITVENCTLEGCYITEDIYGKTEKNLYQ